MVRYWRPVDELHREEPLRAFRQQLAEGDQIWMSYLGEAAELLLKAVEGRTFSLA
jgi:hypothetical protein